MSSLDEVRGRAKDPGQSTTSNRIGRALDLVRRETQRPGSYLVPLRVFIGIGWLRAAAEKLVQEGWLDGTAITRFLDQQLESGQAVFGAYQGLVEHILRPGAVAVGWTVTVLQFAIGVAIITGAFTNLALLLGIGLNVNLMLAGRISPSAFYVVIQVALFAAGTGAVMGVDGLLAGKPRPVVLSARLDDRPATRFDLLWITSLAFGFGSIAAYALLHATDLGPGGINDPAAVLAVVMAVAAFSLLIMRLRMSSNQKRGARGLPGPPNG